MALASSDKLILWATGCQHFGAKFCQVSKFEQHVKEALKLKARTILLGDLINNGVSAGSKHVGLEWQDAMDPMSQCELAVDTLMPLAKARQIEYVVGGNHSYRTVRAVGIHPESFCAMMLSMAADGRKPKAILPAVIQKVHQLADLAAQSSINGRSALKYQEAKGELVSIIAGIPAGGKPNWAIPFYPGMAQTRVDGIPIAAHHGSHNRSKDNWKMLEYAARGFRLYLTGHNHELNWSPARENILADVKKCDFFSCGTYQGYGEEYVSIAGYGPTSLGSWIIEVDKKTDKVKAFPLD